MSFVATDLTCVSHLLLAPRSLSVGPAEVRLEPRPDAVGSISHKTIFMSLTVIVN